jgi:hypothetical protein
MSTLNLVGKINRRQIVPMSCLKRCLHEPTVVPTSSHNQLAQPVERVHEATVRSTVGTAGSSAALMEQRLLDHNHVEARNSAPHCVKSRSTGKVSNKTEAPEPMDAKYGPVW